MSKVADTYWNSISRDKNRNKKRTRSAAKSNGATPQWFIFTVIVSLTFMLCLAINFRAFSEMRQQYNERSELNASIEKLTTESLVLQEEVKNLKSDPRTIEREARKIGMSRPNEKVLVPIY